MRVSHLSWTSALLLGSFAALSACSRSADTGPSNPSPAAAARGAGEPAARTDVAAARALIPTRSTYDVVLKPGTKVIDAQTMAQAYQGAKPDGTLSFDAARAPAVAAIAPGTVVIFAGIALLKVDSVRSTGATISVAGSPAGLEDAIDHGHIAWSAPLDFKKMAFNPPPGFHRTTVEEGPLMALLGVLLPRAEAAVSLSDNSWSGKIKDFDVTIKLTPSSGNLHIDVQATKSIAGGVIDLHGSAQFNGLTTEGSISLADGATTEVTFNNKGLNGSVDFDWKVAFDADHGGGSPEMNESTVENLKFSLDYPIVIGPIPFKVSFKAGYAFQPAFTSKVAVAQGSYHANFGGDMPMTNSAGDQTGGAGASNPASASTGTANPASGSAAASDPSSSAASDAGLMSGSGTINSYGGTNTLAAIGLSTTIAMPKIILTLGLPSELDTFLGSPDFGGPYATLMTQANFLATGSLTMVQCEKRELKIMGFVGYKPGILGKLKLQEVPKPPHPLFQKTYTEFRPPNITLCEH